MANRSAWVYCRQYFWSGVYVPVSDKQEKF